MDHILEGLVGTGLDALRIGSSASVKTSLVQYTLEARFEKHPLASDYRRARENIENREKALDALVKLVKETRASQIPSRMVRLPRMNERSLLLEREIKALRARAYGLYLHVVTDIVTAADVVCTTCISAGARALDVSDFPLVFIDEASMSTEPASLVPLMRGVRSLGIAFSCSYVSDVCRGYSLSMSPSLVITNSCPP